MFIVWRWHIQLYIIYIYTICKVYNMSGAKLCFLSFVKNMEIVFFGDLRFDLIWSKRFEIWDMWFWFEIWRLRFKSLVQKIEIFGNSAIRFEICPWLLLLLNSPTASRTRPTAGNELSRVQSALRWSHHLSLPTADAPWMMSKIAVLVIRTQHARLWLRMRVCNLPTTPQRFTIIGPLWHRSVISTAVKPIN